MSNVKLAIRVRPFTERELKSERDRLSVIDVIDEHTVTITNTKVNVSGAGDSRERIRRYYADYTFDSACPTNSPTYASQEKVFEAIGHEVIANLTRGNSACVMAYGQSATGKTHTMIGTEEQPGLVPRLCRALGQINPFDITVSFLEIYNEKVHDLLVEAAPYCHSLPRRRGNSRKDLRVREHPHKGPYVQNLRRVAVRDVEALVSLVCEGTRRRRTAATRRNTTSSRSHALLEITTSQGTLHLADLAGSEKASWEGCPVGTGGRQKEGANINKSLVALSNVISALVNGSKGRNKFVPYRDSALTWLLKDCFTGGASTFIIATVSPSIGCYGESASTLRWAERARQLPSNKSTATCGTGIHTKAFLQAQYNHLIALLAKNHIRYMPETGAIIYDEHHWQLQNNENSSNNVLNTNANIGSIMNKVLSKSDHNNSESTASSIASENSDVTNTMDKNIKIVEEINKEVNKLFAPSLERTSSGSDLKVIAPVRHKRRQYRSQEVLPLDEVLQDQYHCSNSSLSSSNPTKIHEQNDKAKVTILHESQRAEIVASVTERLYSKLKKKEEAAVSKMEAVVDKKIVEPLSELRICTNARQRLMELSHKALRNKRRIGIPAYTQTRVSVIRVKDQGVDVQSDLESYFIINQNAQCIMHRDVGTETIPMTPRCKEIAVGSKYGTLNLNDRSTGTENKKIICKNSSVMTDVVLKHEQSTQTKVVPPPRRKRRVKTSQDMKSNNDTCIDDNLAPVISINILHSYPCDSETQSSDDNLDKDSNESVKVIAKPDLLTSHLDNCNADHKQDNANISKSKGQVSPNKKLLKPDQFHGEEFNETEEYSLPRVTADASRATGFGDMRNMILGRNRNIYPYNIILSPPKERLTKNIVKFQVDSNVPQSVKVIKEVDGSNEEDVSSRDSLSQSDLKIKYGQEIHNELSECTISDTMSSSSSKLDTDSFIWTQSRTNYLRKHYTPVYKSNSRYRNSRDNFYSDFLDESCRDYSSSDTLGTSSCESVRRKRDHECRQSRFDDAERLLVESCNELEKSANKYDNYLKTFKTVKKCGNSTEPTRTPTEYLQHLVKLRREVVQAESDSTNN